MPTSNSQHAPRHASPGQTVCELAITPDLRIVGMTAEYVGMLCQRILGDEDMASRLVVAAHELLENTIRYSSSSSSSSSSCEVDRSKIRVTFDRCGQTVRIVLETQNKACAARRAELIGLFAEMKAMNNRHAFYQKLIRRTSKRVEGSGLGLGRIHAEAEMELSYEIRGDIVHLRAEAIVPNLVQPLSIDQENPQEMPS